MGAGDVREQDIHAVVEDRVIDGGGHSEVDGEVDGEYQVVLDSAFQDGGDRSFFDWGNKIK